MTRNVYGWKITDHSWICLHIFKPSLSKGTSLEVHNLRFTSTECSTSSIRCLPHTTLTKNVFFLIFFSEYAVILTPIGEGFPCQYFRPAWKHGGVATSSYKISLKSEARIDFPVVPKTLPAWIFRSTHEASPNSSEINAIMVGFLHYQFSHAKNLASANF